MIKIKFLGSFAQGIGKEVELPEGRVKKVRDILELFKGRNSEIYPGNPNIIILVNGVEVGVLRGLETELKDGDEVVLLPAAHGGSSVVCFSVRPEKDLLQKVEKIRKKTKAYLQVCSAECVHSILHAELISLQTLESLKSGEALAERPEMDFLARIALDDQINRAIKKCGHKGGPSILIIFGEDADEAAALVRESLRVGPPTFSTPEKLMKIHGISDKELEAYAGPDRLLSFLVEMSALLVPRKR